MKIIEKISKKQDIYNNPPATIAILGDSVSHGCFECYQERDGNIQTVFDIKSGYSTRMKEMLNVLFPSSQINIINSGLSGDNAVNGASRLSRDIFPYNPDLCIVSYQLNDCSQGKEGLEKYLSALKKIFDELKAKNIEIIFVTENYMCKDVSPLLMSEIEKKSAEFAAKMQNEGINKLYRDEAIKLCQNEKVKYVDMYGIWEQFDKYNVPLDFALANKINHPNRELHYYTAIKILEKMFEE